MKKGRKKILFLLVLAGQSWSADVRVQALLESYPQINRVENNCLYFEATPNSECIEFDDGRKKNYRQKFFEPDVEDMFSQDYFKFSPGAAPEPDHNPGKILHTDFFKKIYGKTEGYVRKFLRKIQWFGTSISVTTVNGVDQKLEKVRDELMVYFLERCDLEVSPRKNIFEESQFYFADTLQLLSSEPKYRNKVANEITKNCWEESKYVYKATSYYWRKKANTKALKTEILSPHSFGIAIDINGKFLEYWGWRKKKEPYQNSLPLEIVEIFEKYGFIWGGRWHGYDTLHFEYRPEIFAYEKLKNF